MTYTQPPQTQSIDDLFRNQHNLQHAFNVQAYGADPYGVNDSTNAIQAAINAAISASAKNGIVYFPAGTYTISAALTLNSGLTYLGAGPGASTVKAGPTYTGNLFTVTITSGTLTDLHMRDLTLDGRVVGTNHCVHIDTSATNAIRYHDITFERVIMQNAYAGWWIAANNASAGISDNSIIIDSCRAVSCSIGILDGGTYGLTVSKTGFISCTIAGMTNSAIIVGSIGSGPTTLLTLRDIYVQCLGNVTTSSTTEVGLAIQSSLGVIDGVRIVGASGTYAFTYYTNESEGSVLNNIEIYSCAGTGLQLAAGSISDPGVCTNVVVKQCGQNTNLNAGYQRVALAVDKGSWFVDHLVVTADTTTMTYALEVGAFGANIFTTIDVNHLDNLAAPVNGFLNIINSQAGGVLRIKNSYGYNPFGQVVVNVPASGTAVTAAPYDRIFYITTAGSTCAIAVPNALGTNQTVATVPANSYAPVWVPAGQAMTPTYANAPTWTVQGL